jgi:hypothetical protein
VHTALGEQVHKYILYVELLVTDGAVEQRHIDSEGGIDSDIDPHHGIDVTTIVEQYPNRYNIDWQCPEADGKAGTRSSYPA